MRLCATLWCEDRQQGATLVKWLTSWRGQLLDQTNFLASRMKHIFKRGPSAGTKNYSFFWGARACKSSSIAHIPILLLLFVTGKIYSISRVVNLHGPSDKHKSCHISRESLLSNTSYMLRVLQLHPIHIYTSIGSYHHAFFNFESREREIHSKSVPFIEQVGPVWHS